jgi:retron-type reverse transcriptase
MKSLDVQAFALNLESNIFALHGALLAGTWEPDAYHAFYVRDPKLRHIHKASVRDRVLYQAIFRVLYPVFDPGFIHDSYSCRTKKGTHRGVLQLERYLRKASRNWRRPVYALKCDVRKFFDSISHDILLGLIRKKVSDAATFTLIEQIVRGFEVSPGRGLPLGNVTSQLFANVYLNELDQFAKHRLKIQYYLRYCDDFVCASSDKEELTAYIPEFRAFLESALMLELHPDKISLRKASTGIDFLGYVVFPFHRVVRTTTRRRMVRKLTAQVEARAAGEISDKSLLCSLESYKGILQHAKSHSLGEKIAKITQALP